MPNITPYGLVQQVTMMARNVQDAAELSRMLLEPDRTEVLADADLWTRQIRCWENYCEMYGWWTAQRHASTMAAMSEVTMLALNAGVYGSPEGDCSPEPN